MARKKPQSAATLSDHTAALNRAIGALPRVVAVCGEEAFLRRQAIGALLDALRQKRPGIEVVTFRGSSVSGESDSLASVLREMSTSSLFASEKIIVLRQADRLLFPLRGSDEQESPARKDAPGRRQSRPEEALVAQIQSPPGDTWILIECEKAPKNRKLGKALHAEACMIPCPALKRQADVAAWLHRAAADLGKKLAPGVADLLFMTHGGQLGVLHAELDKLATYIGAARKRIDRADVEAFLSGRLEFEVFGLTNAVEARDLKKALIFARRIIDQGTRDQTGRRTEGSSSAHRSLYMLAMTLENLLAARVEMAKGRNADVAAATGTSPWRAEHLEKAAARFSVAELRRALVVLARESHASHSTGSDVGLSLERAVFGCCR